LWGTVDGVCFKKPLTGARTPRHVLGHTTVEVGQSCVALVHRGHSRRVPAARVNDARVLYPLGR